MIAIIGILSAVVMTVFGESQRQARDNARQTDLKNVQLAIERYRADNGSFPEAGDGWWGVLIPEYLSSEPSTDWEWYYQATDTQDRYILSISGVESLFTNVDHEFACPESEHTIVVDEDPCDGDIAEPDTVYAVYSEGVRTLPSP